MLLELEKLNNKKISENSIMKFKTKYFHLMDL